MKNQLLAVLENNFSTFAEYIRNSQSMSHFSAQADRSRNLKKKLPGYWTRTKRTKFPSPRHELDTMASFQMHWPKISMPTRWRGSHYLTDTCGWTIYQTNPRYTEKLFLRIFPIVYPRKLPDFSVLFLIGFRR